MSRQGNKYNYNSDNQSTKQYLQDQFNNRSHRTFVQQRRGKLAIATFSKRSLQYVMTSRQQRKKIFGQQLNNALQLRNRILIQSMTYYSSSIGLSLITSYLLNKKYPTVPIGYWRLKKFTKYFAFFALPLIIMQSYELGEQARNMLQKHSSKINSPKLLFFFNKYRQQYQQQ